MFDLAAVQSALADLKLDGWLLYDFRGLNVLARRVLEELKLKGNVVSLARELGPELSRCAAALALAVLAREGPK